MNKPKYSIIIPTCNGIKYIETCIETIISQDYKDFELILSDDNSTDGTREYLGKLNHPNIVVIYPPESLSMTEHWEWALSHAKGEWQIFVGQDDGLQAYFFHLADKLTCQAKEKGLRTIMSSRAYFFWPGCQYAYGDIAVHYVAENKTRVHNIKYETLKALLGLQDYFELPQMYTTALFHKDLLNEAKLKQNGKVFSCHPQDANLAAIACSLEKKYLKSYIPLGWVGSSPRSAGMAISSDLRKANENDAEALIKLRSEYQNKVNKSKIKYHELAGEFSFGSLPVYFWQAFLQTPNLRTSLLNKILISKPFKIMMFSSIKKTSIKRNKLPYFEDLIKKNNISSISISLCAPFMALIYLVWSILDLISKIMRKLAGRIKQTKFWNKNLEIDMLNESSEIKKKLRNKIWI